MTTLFSVSKDVINNSIDRVDLDFIFIRFLRDQIGDHLALNIQIGSKFVSK